MRVMIIEDNPTNLAVLTGIVRRMEGIDCVGYSEPNKALEDLQERQSDLVIVDYLMPEINGLAIIGMMRSMSQHLHVPIVMITADGDRKRRLDAVAAGATDFLAKPVDPMELKMRVGNLLAMRGAQNALEARAATLSHEIAMATEHLRQREEEVVYRLARAIEFRDNETSEHVARVARVSGLIALKLGLAEEFVRTLSLAAPLHDVGKIGIPDAILGKPGRLDPEERMAMQRHAEIGAQILSDGDSDLVRMAADVAGSHHERWDGTGYPNQLAGETIPLAARITAVADVFDALCSPRCYKPAWAPDAAREEILRTSGAHFDPTCVAAFERAWPIIKSLYHPPSMASNAA